MLNGVRQWWYRDQKPFPRPTTIAPRMGTTVRTVQRAIVRMRRAGLLSQERDASGRMVLNPAPLVGLLGAFAQTDVDYLIRTEAEALVA